ncbi:tRNA pseudouridine(13) synthase TruD [Mucisphaera calidilacus]|uniref:tRNA pseudouridine synthase D n=1 Tax=Mucisphaera calidilacus TaxID=2527982 RepID=A0A518BTF1_9BACT|nr:tRNA pseudouridine(13) synthase TruD [Mucisphaera calidilacus]QDU70248.1 tRNA pseudouridine synthase D [Mucisphaera calidilacus]
MSLTENLALLTDDHPGIGGVIKERPEDFIVEEQPLYEPAGEGEHLYLYIEKRKLTTADAVRRIAKAFRVGRRDVGYAGLKDKHALTRQLVSVYLPGRTAEQENEYLERVDMPPRLRVVWHDRHANKLRRGHHAGNRFIIRVRRVKPTDVIHANAILQQLEQRGAPNYLGQQRFGYRDNAHLIGAALLQQRYQDLLDTLLGKPLPIENENLQAARRAYDQGDYDTALEHCPRSLRHDRQALEALRQGKTAEQTVQTIDMTQRQLYISALQGAAFNAVLDSRIRENRFDRLVPGDLAWKHDNGSVFAVDKQTADTENAPGGRIHSHLVSPSGPMWGPRMIKPEGDILNRELLALEQLGVGERDLEAAGKHDVGGGRRALRVFAQELQIESGADEHGPYIETSFTLPRGAFATMILREVMKNDVPDASLERLRPDPDKPQG